MTATLVEFPTSFHKQECFRSVISTNMEVDIDAKELADRMAAAEAMSALSSVVRVNPGDSPASPRTSKRIASRGTRGGGRGKGRKTNQGDKIPNSEAKKSRSRIRTNHDTTKSNVTDAARNKPTRAASKSKGGAQEQAPKRSPRRKSKSGQSEPETPTKTRTKRKNSSSEYGEMPVLEPQVTNASSTVPNIPSLPSALSLTLPSLNIPSLGTLPTLGSIPIFHPDTNSGDKTKQDNKSLPFKKRRLINSEHSEDSEDQESKTEGAQTQECHGQAYIVTVMGPPEPRHKFYKLLEIDKSKAGKNHQEKRYIDKELYDKTIQAVESRKYERCPTGDAHFKDWAKGFSVKCGLDGVKVLLSNPDKLIEKRRKQEVQRRNRQKRRAESEQEEEDLDNGRRRPKKETKELPVLIKEKYFDEIFKCHQEAKHSKEGTWRLVKDRWCMVTKQIITRFCQTCPTCNITQKKRTFLGPSTSECSAAKRAYATSVADTEASWSSFSSSQTDETMPGISTEVASGWNQYTPRTSEVMPEIIGSFTGYSQNLPSDLQKVNLQTLDSMSATSNSLGHQWLSAPSSSPGYRDTRSTQMHQRFSCSSIDSSGSSSSFYHQETHGFLVQNLPVHSSMIPTIASPTLIESRSQGTKTCQGFSTHFGQLESCESTVPNPVESTNTIFSGLCPLMTAMPGRGRDANLRSQVPAQTFSSEAESKVLSVDSTPSLTTSSAMTQRWVASLQSEMTGMSTGTLPHQSETRYRESFQLNDSPSLSLSSSQRLEPPTSHTMGMSTMIIPSQDKNASKKLISTSPIIRSTSAETWGWIDPTQAQTAPTPQMSLTEVMSHRLPSATIPQVFTSAPGPMQEEDGQTITNVGQTLSKSTVFNTSSTPPLTYSQSSFGSYQTQSGINSISRSESSKTLEGQAPSHEIHQWSLPASSYLTPNESPSASPSASASASASTATASPFTPHQVQTFHTLTVPSNVSSDHAYTSMFNQSIPGFLSLASRPACMSNQLYFYGQGQMSNYPRLGQVSKSPRQGHISKTSRQGQMSNSPQPIEMSHSHRQGQISESAAILKTHKLPPEANVYPKHAHFPSNNLSQAASQKTYKIPVFGTEEMYVPFHQTREFGLGISGISNLDDVNSQQTHATGQRISTEQDLITSKNLVPSCQSQDRSAECNLLTSQNFVPSYQSQGRSAEWNVLTSQNLVPSCQSQGRSAECNLLTSQNLVPSCQSQGRSAECNVLTSQILVPSCQSQGRSAECDILTSQNLVPSCQSQGRSAECNVLTSQNLVPSCQSQGRSAECNVLTSQSLVPSCQSQGRSAECDILTSQNLVPSCQSQGRSAECDILTSQNLDPSCQSQDRSAECNVLTSQRLVPSCQSQGSSAERNVLAQSTSTVDHARWSPALQNVPPKKNLEEHDVPKSYCSPEGDILPEMTSAEQQTRAESDVFTQMSYTELTQSIEEPDLLLQWILEQTPGFAGDHGTPGLSGDHDAPGLPGDHNTPGLSGHQYTSGLSGDHDAPGHPGDHNSPGLSGNHNTPELLWEHNAPGFPGDHDAPGHPGDHNTPCLTGDNTPGLTGDHYTACLSGDHNTQRLTGDHRENKH